MSKISNQDRAAWAIRRVLDEAAKEHHNFPTPATFRGPYGTLVNTVTYSDGAESVVHDLQDAKALVRLYAAKR